MALGRRALAARAGNCDDLWRAIRPLCRRTADYDAFLLWLVLSGFAQSFEYSVDWGAAPDTLTILRAIDLAYANNEAFSGEHCTG